MKNKLISLFLTICILVLPICLSGCGNKKSTTATVAVDTEAQSEVFKEAAEKYQKETKNVINVKSVSDNTSEKTKVLKDQSETPTVFLLSDISEYEDLKEYCSDIDDCKLNSYLFSKKLAIKSDDGDKTYAIPYDISGYGIIINEKITDKYFKLDNLNGEYNSLDDITDFKALKQLVNGLNKNKIKLGIESVFASPSLSQNDAYDWNSGIFNTPLYYEFSKNDDYSNADEAFYKSREIDFRYDNEYKELLDLVINNSTDKSTFETKTEKDSIAEFKQGKAAMILGTDKMVLEGTETNNDKLKFLPLYADISGEDNQGITIKREKFFAVNSKADEDEQQAGLDFLDWLFSSETGKKIVTNKLNILTPFNTFSENDLPEYTLKKETVKSLKDDNAENVFWMLSAPVRDITKSATSLAVRGYASGKKTFEEIKNELKERWKMANR